jgi:uncharacterized protein with PIN domain
VRKGEPRFLADRMLGTLTRYLRLMGYDTESAASMREGNRREDSLLLERASREGRILLTRDRELARRADGMGVLIEDERVNSQIRQLKGSGLIDLSLRMDRCCLCNEPLRRATPGEVARCPYAPERRDGTDFYWCRRCRRLYWAGTHGRNLQRRLDELCRRG